MHSFTILLLPWEGLLIDPSLAYADAPQLSTLADHYSFPKRHEISYSAVQEPLETGNFTQQAPETGPTNATCAATWSQAQVNIENKNYNHSTSRQIFTWFLQFNKWFWFYRPAQIIISFLSLWHPKNNKIRKSDINHVKRRIKTKLSLHLMVSIIHIHHIGHGNNQFRSYNTYRNTLLYNTEQHSMSWCFLYLVGHNNIGFI